MQLEFSVPSGKTRIIGSPRNGPDYLVGDFNSPEEAFAEVEEYRKTYSKRGDDNRLVFNDQGCVIGDPRLKDPKKQ